MAKKKKSEKKAPPVPLSVLNRIALGPSKKEKAIANERAIAASNDLGCPDCDCDRPFKPGRYKLNPDSKEWELVTWKLLGGWKGKHCPKCQPKYDRLAEKATQDRLADQRRQREVAEKERKLGIKKRK